MAAERYQTLLYTYCVVLTDEDEKDSSWILTQFLMMGWHSQNA